MTVKFENDNKNSHVWNLKCLNAFSVIQDFSSKKKGNLCALTTKSLKNKFNIISYERYFQSQSFKNLFFK